VVIVGNRRGRLTVQLAVKSAISVARTAISGQFAVQLAHRKASRRHRRRQRTGVPDSARILTEPSDKLYVDEAHWVADGIQSVTIGTIETSEPGTFKMVNCHQNGVSVGLLLNLGALNNKVYFNALASYSPLQPHIIALRTYSGSSIPRLGCVTLNVELNIAVIRDFRFYVTEHGMSVTFTPLRRFRRISFAGWGPSRQQQFVGNDA